jgi:hypothetical protein
MTPKSGYRFPAGAKPVQPLALALDASAGEARSDKIMRKQTIADRCGQIVTPIDPIVL